MTFTFMSPNLISWIEFVENTPGVIISVKSINLTKIKFLNVEAIEDQEIAPAENFFLSEE